jgi:hypothetical protein
MTHRRSLVITLLLAFVLGAVAALSAAGALGAATAERVRVSQSSSSSPRLLAVGDIHGAYDEFVALLKRAGLIDEQLRWSGGRSVLVQTGDYTDRGTGVRKVLDLLMRLEREARGAGGQLHVVLGNHEVMNLIGDWRDVTPEICATFADDKSEEKRQTAWTQASRLMKAGGPAVSQTEWMAAHPPGCLEYRAAMSTSGTYGRWLREKPIAVVVQGTLFMHAGINPTRPLPASVDEVVTRARTEIKRLDAYRQLLVSRKLALPFYSLQQLIDVSGAQLRDADARIIKAKAEGTPLQELSLDVPVLREAQELMNVGTWSLVDPEGPLWYRGHALAPEDATSADVLRLRTHLKLSRIVVGHTPTPDRRVAVRHAGTVVVIDTGMLRSAYMGNPVMLEITPDRLKAIYLDGEVELKAAPKAAAIDVPTGTVSSRRARRPVALATAKLTPFRFFSGDTPGIGRG